MFSFWSSRKSQIENKTCLSIRSTIFWLILWIFVLSNSHLIIFILIYILFLLTLFTFIYIYLQPLKRPITKPIFSIYLDLSTFIVLLFYYNISFHSWSWSENFVSIKCVTGEYHPRSRFFLL